MSENTEDRPTHLHLANTMPAHQIERHQMLHRHLDELLACYLAQRRPQDMTVHFKPPSIHDSIYDLMKFSHAMSEGRKP